MQSFMSRCVSAFNMILVLWAGLAWLPGKDPPPPEAAPIVELPRATFRLLPNGLKLLLVERHSTPLVTLALVVRSGAADDPEELPGVAQMVTYLLDQGTTRRTDRRIAEALDRMGGMIQKEAEWDDSLLAFTVLSDSLEEASALLADLILNPVFPREAVERQRQQMISALQLASQEPSYLADTVFEKVLFQASRYGHPLDGTLASLGRIRAEDLRAFHRRHYRPENAILALAGDFKPRRGRKLAEKHFGSWKSGSAEAAGRSQIPALPASRRRIIVIDKPDAVQTEIRVGNLAVPRNSEEYAAIEVANEILGGTAPDRLFEALRMEEGLIYGVESRLDARKTAGHWVVETATRTGGTLKSLKIILREMDRLATRRVSRSEFEMARSYLTGHLWLEFESMQGISGKLLDLLVYDLPADYWHSHGERLETLTRDDLLEVTRKWLRPESSLVVLVGDAQQFRDGLEPFGKVDMIPLSSLDLDAPTLGLDATEPKP